MSPRVLMVVLFCGLLLPQAVLGQSQTRSPAAAGDCTSQGGIGSVAWGTPADAISSNDSYAAATVDGQTTNYLRCLNYGFSIPIGSTILGIEVHVERKSDRTSNGGSNDAAMRLVKAGVIQAGDRATASIYGTTDEIETHGGPADLWGTTWTAAEINAANFGAAFAAIKPSSNGPAHDITVDHISITVYYTPPTTPGSFNAFEPATAAGAITGVIRTKVAGSAFSLDVVAILSGAQFGGFTNTVIVELLGNNTLGVALDANNCPTSFTLLQTVSPNPTIAGGRSTVNFAAVANSWRDVRVRVRYPTASPTVTSCSTDNFAIRPASFSLTATDSDWQSAGAARALNNSGAAGGMVHKAGRPFTLTVTPAPGTAMNYNGDPTVSALACSLPTPCADGALTVGAFAGSGTRVSNTAAYSEAGAFNLTLVDQTYAAVDAADGTPADCSAAGRYVCQSAAPLAVGRFVPDHFALTAVTAPVFRTFDVADAACSVPPAGAVRTFTYIGQPFGYETAPSATVLARNAAGATTTNYRGALWKLNAASASQAFANSPVLPLDTALILAPSLTEVANSGTGTLSANAGDRVSFVRDNATPSAPFTANLSLTWSVADTSESGPSQGTITTATPLVFNGGGGGIAFDSGSQFRYGRLYITNANGSQLVPLRVLMETQYWGGSSFLTNAADHCTSLANDNVAMSAFGGNLSACETALSGAGTLAAGRRTLLLAAPGNANDGSVILTANLGTAAAGTTCTTVGGAPVAANGADLLYLQGNWTGAAFDDNPSARATFGTFKGSGEVIFMRENF